MPFVTYNPINNYHFVDLFLRIFPEIANSQNSKNKYDEKPLEWLEKLFE